MSFKMMNSFLPVFKNRMVILCSEKRSISLADTSFLFPEIGTKSQHTWRPCCGKTGHTFLTGSFLQRQLAENYQVGKRMRARGLKWEVQTIGRIRNKRSPMLEEWTYMQMCATRSSFLHMPLQSIAYFQFYYILIHSLKCLTCIWSSLIIICSVFHQTS